MLDTVAFFLNFFLCGFSKKYYLLRIVFLFCVVHPGSAATFEDTKVFLESRYPNRHLDVFHLGSVSISPRGSLPHEKQFAKFNPYEVTPSLERIRQKIVDNCHGMTKTLGLKINMRPPSPNARCMLAFVPPVTPTQKTSFAANDLQSRRWSSVPNHPSSKTEQHYPSSLCMVFGLGGSKKTSTKTQDKAPFFPSYLEEQENSSFWNKLSGACTNSISMVEFHAQEAAAYGKDDKKGDGRMSLVGYLDIDPYAASNTKRAF
mmetsp:Transcript_8204/g.12506  ORF Transcript_8204/g.12506 Transcript_8204/m.12506 type:complete len:260 (+) Transcript_8204:216-995(+)